MPRALPKTAAFALALVAAAALRAEPAVVGLARAYLGPDSTLSGITSIHFVGTLDRVDPDKGGAPMHGSLDLVFVKPLRQRLVVHMDKTTLTTVLDGYDAWDFLQDNADHSKFELKWLSAGDIKTLRANTWENLYFFRGLEGEGAIVDKGPAMAEGIACERVDFIHDPSTVYERYFDRDTGRLVKTVRGPETFRESGEIRVDGLRFSRTITSDTKLASGKDLISTVTFSSIAINEPVSPDAFVAPDIVAAKQPPAAQAK